MKESKHNHSLHLPGGLGRLTLASAIVSYLVIVLGGIVRATNANLTCAGWPLCAGQWSLLSDPLALISFSHRLATLLAAPLVGAAIVWALAKFRQERWVSLSLLAAGIILIIQILVGRFLALQTANQDLND